MHQTTRKRIKNQQKHIADHACKTDCHDFFNLLTGPKLLDAVEAQLPEYRQRLYTPTVTLSLFMAHALSSDGSCRNTVMPDTLENQAIYPQQSGQKPGLCFPNDRIIGLSCLAGGAGSYHLS